MAARRARGHAQALPGFGAQLEAAAPAGGGVRQPAAAGARPPGASAAAPPPPPGSGGTRAPGVAALGGGDGLARGAPVTTAEPIAGAPPAPRAALSPRPSPPGSAAPAHDASVPREAVPEAPPAPPQAQPMAMPLVVAPNLARGQAPIAGGPQSRPDTAPDAAALAQSAAHAPPTAEGAPRSQSSGGEPPAQGREAMPGATPTATAAASQAATIAAAVNAIASALSPPSLRLDPAATTAPAAALHAAPTPTAPPVLQLGAAIASLSGGGGLHRLTVALAPAELGAVHIALVRAADGTTALTITAARAETLTQLRGSTVALDQALDQAGIAAAGRSVSFALEADPPAASADPAPGQTQALAAGLADPGQGGNQTPHHAPRGAADTGAADTKAADTQPTPLAYRGVVDLTA